MTDMIYNHAPTAVYSMKISAMAKLVYERMYSLSKDATQVIFFKQVDFANFFNVSRMTIFRAVNELIESKLLELTEPAKKVPFDQTKYYLVKEPKIEQKTAESVDSVQCTETVQSNVQQLDNRMSNTCTLPMSNSDTLECTSSVHCQCTTSVHSSLDRNKKEYISKKEREAKRSASALSSYSSYEDFMPLFTQLAEQFKDEHLAIGRMYLPTVVKKFFNHYQARKFRWKHGVNADATEWLLNECTHIEGNLLRDTKSENQCKHQQVMNAIGESIRKEAEQKGTSARQITNELIELSTSSKGATIESEIIEKFMKENGQGESLKQLA